MTDSRAIKIINAIEYITIATADKNGTPWNTPVYAAFDDDYNFYWFSDQAAQHSQNIRSSGKAFLVIYDSTAPAYEGEGVYLEVTAHEITNRNELITACKYMDTRLKRAEPSDLTDYSGDALMRGYKATPVKTWMNDSEYDQTGNYMRDVRVKVELTVR
jgi:hypothetical protein